MNLWRVRDRRGDRAGCSGEPEPVTTPVDLERRPSFSRDGTRLAFASLDCARRCSRVPFDPAREDARRPAGADPAGHAADPRPRAVSRRPVGRVHRRRRRRRTCSSRASTAASTGGSPTTRSATAGRPGRRTGRASRSTRTAAARYELWTIRPDGSGSASARRRPGLHQLPVWSPDGKQLLTYNTSTGGVILDLAAGFARRSSRTPAGRPRRDSSGRRLVARRETGSPARRSPPGRSATSISGRSPTAPIARCPGAREGLVDYSLAFVDRDHLVYGSGGEVWLGDLRGGEPRRLSSGARPPHQQHLSPRATAAVTSPGSTTPTSRTSG